MRKIITFLLFLCFVILFGFAFAKTGYNPVDSLIRPPKVDGDSSEIQTVFENSVGSDYLLKAPLSGEYRTSFIRKDLDSDDDDEVFVLYCKTETPDVVRINVLDKVDGSWQSVSDIVSNYSDIYEISFADLDNDRTSELIVCWRAFANEVSSTLSVYRVFINEQSKDFERIFSKSYIEFSVCDVNSDGKTDILLFEKSLSNGNPEIKGIFYDFSSGKSVSNGEFIVDPAVSTIGSVCFDYIEEYGGLRIYVDGYKTDSGVTTDLVLWDNSENVFIRPQHDGEASIVTVASRNKNIYSSDINSDNIVEIPIADYIKNSVVVSSDNSESETQNIIKWVQYDGYRLEEVETEIFVSEYNYSLKIPSDYFGEFTVENNIDDGILTFYIFNEFESFEPPENRKPNNKKDDPQRHLEGEDREKEKLFSIFATAEQDYGIYELSGYRFICSDNGFSYYCQLYDAAKEMGITKDIIKSILFT